jgi:hypothetical protein
VIVGDRYDPRTSASTSTRSSRDPAGATRTCRRRDRFCKVLAVRPSADTPCPVHSREPKLPSADRCHPTGRVPPSWFHTTSTVFSTGMVAGLLQPAADRGSPPPASLRLANQPTTRPLRRIHPRTRTLQRVRLPPSETGLAPGLTTSCRVTGLSVVGGCFLRHLGVLPTCRFPASARNARRCSVCLLFRDRTPHPWCRIRQPFRGTAELPGGEPPSARPRRCRLFRRGGAPTPDSRANTRPFDWATLKSRGISTSPTSRRRLVGRAAAHQRRSAEGLLASASRHAASRGSRLPGQRTRGAVKQRPQPLPS